MIRDDEAELAVYHCKKCNFDVGLDASFLEQVEEIVINCPNPDCDAVLDTEAIEKELMPETGCTEKV